jgi:hypothetical protein
MAIIARAVTHKLKGGFLEMAKAQPAKRDDYLSFAKKVKGEMDYYKEGFYSYEYATFIGTAKTSGISEEDLDTDDGLHSLKTAFQELGLKFAPEPKQAKMDGYVRVIRAGSLLGTIVSNLETPGPGSDHDLANLLNELKGRTDRRNP